MIIGEITKPNKKGQIVIPKEFREALSINEEVVLNLVLRGKGIYIYPVESLVLKGEADSAYLNILKKTKGAWAKDTWKETRRKRRKIEIHASKKRKRIW